MIEMRTERGGVERGRRRQEDRKRQTERKGGKFVKGGP